MPPEVYRLAARVCWLVGRPAQAFRWWARGIAECEKLGARPELGRTHMDAGQLTSAADGKHAALNGMPASTCLDRARSLFVELGLEWDHAQLSAARPCPA